MVDTAFSSSMYVYQGARKPPHAMVKSTMKGHSTTPGAEGRDLKKQTQMLNEFFFVLQCFDMIAYMRLPAIMALCKNAYAWIIVES